jgi:hypothetical protein
VLRNPKREMLSPAPNLTARSRWTRGLQAAAQNSTQFYSVTRIQPACTTRRIAKLSRFKVSRISLTPRASIIDHCSS